MAFKRVFSLALAAALAASLTACGNSDEGPSQDQENAGVAVQVETVEYSTISNENRVSGRLYADTQTPVIVAASAQVNAVYVEVGDVVQNGDPICALDMSSTLASYNAAVISRDSALQSYQDQAAIFDAQLSLYDTQLSLLDKQIENLNAQVAVLVSQLDTLNSQLAMAQKNYNDTEVLMAAGAASQLELDQARLAMEQAQTGLDQATLSLEQAKVGVEQAQVEREQLLLAKANTQAQKNSTLAQLQAGAQSYQANVDQLASVLENVDGSGNVIAPASGVISSLSVVENGFASAASPIAVIDAVEQMKVIVAVSEVLVPKIAVDDTVDLTVDAIGGSYTGTIRNIDFTANAQTGLYMVTISVPAGTSGLRTGMFADVTFRTDTSQDALVVPTEAILTSGNTQYVFVVENGTAVYVEVTTGLISGGVTEVLTGLREGQQLVTVGQSYLHDGDPVRIVNQEA